MSDEQHDDADSRPSQGADAEAAVAGAAAPPGAALTEGERMARSLVSGIAAFEVDPPPPARADPS